MNEPKPKNEAAAALGRLGAGKPKHLTPEDRARRRELMIRLNQTRKTVVFKVGPTAATNAASPMT